MDIALSEFFPISQDWGGLWIPNLSRMLLIEAKPTGDEGGGRVKVTLPSTQIRLSMYDLLLLPSTKGLREKNTSETKISETKVYEIDLKIERTVELKMANEKSYIAFTYLYMSFVLLWHDIT